MMAGSVLRLSKNLITRQNELIPNRAAAFSTRRRIFDRPPQKQQPTPPQTAKPSPDPANPPINNTVQQKPSLDSILGMNSMNSTSTASFKKQSSTASSSPLDNTDADILKEETNEEILKKERIERQAEEKDAEKHAKVLKGVGIAMLFSLVSGFFYFGYPNDNDDKKEDESFIGGYLRRFKRNLLFGYSTVAAPVFGEKLLPDPLPEQYQRPLTLVIELNDALVHLVWDKEIGWRVATRPGVKDLLGYLTRYYELVFFSKSPAMTTQPVADALDPYQQAMYKLYRESTRLVNGKPVKDLSTLNRDIGKVICVDIDKDSYSLQPENGVLLKKWGGESGDRELARLITFLEELALFVTISGAKDIRPILAMLNRIPDAKDLPDAWEKNKQKSKQLHAVKSATAQSPGILSKLLGKRIAEPAKSLFETIEYYAAEERAAYEKDKASQLKVMKEMRKQAEEEQRKMLEGMKAKNMKMFDYLFAGDAMQQQQQQQKK